MLLTRPRAIPANLDTTSVHNYYERLVTDAILTKEPRAKKDYDFLADVSCVALNHLPPRYIRHDVDMTFYLSPVELEEIYRKVDEAVNHAIEFVTSREKENLEDDIQEH
jgi:hypothetical protein